MSKMSDSCFICGKPSVMFYDFIAIERTSQTVSKGAARQTTTVEKIKGIVRITLCKDCLKDAVVKMISAKTNKNGKPMLFEKKKVEDMRLIAEEIDKGIYNKTHDKMSCSIADGSYMDGFAKVFVSALGASFTHIVSLYRHTAHNIPDDQKNLLQKRLSNLNIESQYVLWTPNQSSILPFSCGIVPEFGYEINLYCMSFNEHGNIFDEYIQGLHSSVILAVKKQIPAIYDLYKSSLMDV